ncbi:Unknown protein, partial [Striga hermonthica]
MLQSAGRKASCAIGGLRRLAHAVARLLPLSTAIDPKINTSLPPLIFPEDYDDKNVKMSYLVSHFLVVPWNS